jgi:hypothetical protein
MDEKVIDVKFRKKLELSYQKCLEELCSVEWERLAKERKYEIDEDTGLIRTHYDFELQFPEEIDIPNSEHTYIFNRSHFYRKSSRLKYEMESVWNKRGYYVRLFESDGLWYLRLGWNWNKSF